VVHPAVKVGLWQFWAFPVPPTTETGDCGGFDARGHLLTFGFLHQTLEIKQAAASLLHTRMASGARLPGSLPDFRMEARLATPSASEQRV
jgi:hypothetical protein